MRVLAAGALLHVALAIVEDVAVLGHQVDHGVEHGAGVLHVAADELDVDAEAAALGELRDNLFGVVGTKTLVDEPLGVEVAHVLAAHVIRTVLVCRQALEHGDGKAAFDGGLCALDAGVAATHDDDVGLDGVGAHVVGHLGLLSQARQVAHGARLDLGGLLLLHGLGGARLALLLLLVSRSVLFGGFLGVCRTGNARSGDGQRGAGGTDELPTVE